MHRKPDAPVRADDEVGIGDFVQVAEGWKRLAAKPANLCVRTQDGCEYSQYKVMRYAKAEDLLDRRSKGLWKWLKKLALSVGMR